MGNIHISQSHLHIFDFKKLAQRKKLFFIAPISNCTMVRKSVLNQNIPIKLLHAGNVESAIAAIGVQFYRENATLLDVMPRRVRLHC